MEDTKYILDQRFIKQAKVAAAYVTADEGWGNAKIGNDTYRLRVWIETFYFNPISGPENRVAIKFRSYSRALAIYWGMEAPVTASFSFGIYNSYNPQWSYTYNHSGWVQKEGYEYLAASRPAVAGNQPFFTNYNCYAYNTVTTNKGTCKCEVRLIY